MNKTYKLKDFQLEKTGISIYYVLKEPPVDNIKCVINLEQDDAINVMIHRIQRNKNTNKMKIIGIVRVTTMEIALEFTNYYFKTIFPQSKKLMI